MISEQEGKQILGLARGFIESEFSNKKIKKPENPKYKTKSGVFVTIKKNDELRGCIGYVEPIFPLVEALEKAALAAAFEDPRFPPLENPELQEVSIEVSILTEPELIEVDSPKEYPGEVNVGDDGLIVSRGMHSGLLLPQVAVEQEWDAQQFLSHACMKAMLAPDAWLDKNTKIYKFQCQIFSEKDGDVQ